MEESSARARLVDSTGNGTSVLTTIPRAEFENALRFQDDPPDLVLDVTRYTGEGEAKTPATGKVSVSLSREDLEEILRRSQGDAVTISFDGDELLRAFDVEVEAHGIREVAAVLAVAVAAGAATGVAAAQPTEGTGSGGTAAATQADYGVPRAMPSDYAAQPDEYGAPRAMPSDYAAQPDEYGAPRAMPSDYAAQPTSDGGIHVTLPSPEVTGALAGAAALLITGAAFAARSKRRVTPA